LTAFLAGSFLLPLGCSRKHYRCDADRDVYGLLNTTGECNPLWKMDNFTLNADRNSRYANRYNPDAQPMPQDDATAHRLMEEVDGKKGSRKWNKNGFTDKIDNENWRNTLPVNEDGEIVIDQKVAFDLALMHSPDYRTALENVYGAALNVTLQRYAFDVKFWGTDSLFYNNVGGFKSSSVSSLSNNVDLGAERSLATGADILVSIANSMVWTFSPANDTFTPSTTLGYSLTQPLLRGAGRAIALENLTLSERQLLANVRQLALYQQGFYVGVLTGASPVSIPVTNGYPGIGVANISGTNGYYGLLSSQVQIRNQQSNVFSFQDNYNRYEEYFKTSRVTNRTDVDRVRQNLLSGQSKLISLKNAYRDSIDNYLIALGLPPDIDNVVIRDPLLDQFKLMPEDMEQLQNDISTLLTKFYDRENDIPDNLADIIRDFHTRELAGAEATAQDINQLILSIVPARKVAFMTIKKRFEAENPEMDSSFCDPDLFVAKVKEIRDDFDRRKVEYDENGNPKPIGARWSLENIFRLMELTILKYDPATLNKMILDTRNNPGRSPFSQEVIDLAYQLQLDDVLDEKNVESVDLDIISENDLKDLDPDVQTEIRKERDKLLAERRAIIDDVTVSVENEAYRDWLNNCLNTLINELMGMRLIQARARLEMIQLPIIDIDAEEAFQVAAEHRFDWMNARASLVDQWRNIEIVADRLRSDLNISIGGNISNDGSNPLNFSSDKAELYARLYFDAPLDRFQERNAYRQVLISYDQKRRSYYSYVDSVNGQIRSTVRAIQLAQIDFELQREQVLTAILRVHQNQLDLTKPPTTSSKIGSVDTSAENLINSLNTLMDSQNSIMTTWLGYQTRRMGLLLQMGAFQLDENGRWIDPGNIDSQFLQQFMADVTQTQDELTGINNLPPVEAITGGLSGEQLQNFDPVPNENAETNATLTTESPAVSMSAPALPVR